MTLDRHPRGDRGVALVIALMAMTMMAALGTALILTTTAESRITRNFRNGTAAFYAADAGLARALADLQTIPDWSIVLGGHAWSTFADGSPDGARTLADGTALDLGEVLNLASCGKADPCSSADMDAVTAERPWGSNNPRWRPFAWGRLDDMAPGRAVSSPFYVIVMAGDDPSECDDNPLVDGGPMVSCPAQVASNPGAGVLVLRAEAFGPFGAHRTVMCTIARGNSTARAAPAPGPPVYNDSVGNASISILSWREVR